MKFYIRILLVALMLPFAGGASAAAVIDFGTGLAGPGGTLTESAGDVVGSNILIGSMSALGTGNDGTYVVQGGLLNFDTAANTISINGSITALGIISPIELLTGSFSDFDYSTSAGGYVNIFEGGGIDFKHSDLLNALGLATDIAFEFFGFSLEAAGAGIVVSTDLVNTQVPLPAAAWLFGSAIMGLTVVARRRRVTS